MSLEEQFSEPPEWWDEHVARMEAEYREMIRGKSCLDCAKCVRSDRYPCGYCTEDGEMRYADDRPGELGLECFVSAA